MVGPAGTSWIHLLMGIGAAFKLCPLHRGAPGTGTLQRRNRYAVGLTAAYGPRNKRLAFTGTEAPTLSAIIALIRIAAETIRGYAAAKVQSRSIDNDGDWGGGSSPEQVGRHGTTARQGRASMGRVIQPTHPSSLEVWGMY